MKIRPPHINEFNRFWPQSNSSVEEQSDYDQRALLDSETSRRLRFFTKEKILLMGYFEFSISSEIYFQRSPFGNFILVDASTQTKCTLDEGKNRSFEVYKQNRLWRLIILAII